MKHLASSTLLSLFLTTALFSPLLHAQSNDDDSTTSEEAGNRRFWEANLPGGNYMVALDRITAVSMHSYVLDGGIVVSEVTIDTLGTTVARFYQLTPVAEYGASQATKSVTERGKEILKRGSESTGMDPTTTVQKKYPLTTHAKTIEYQVSSLEELDALYNNIKKSWEAGRGRKFSIK